MLRALLIAVILCFSLELSGTASALFGDPDCTDECPSERSGTPCPPNCHACSCCSLPKTTPPPAAVEEMAWAPTRSLPWRSTSDLPNSPDPADILHVPKLIPA